MHDIARIRNGLNIRRPKRKSNIVNESHIKACLSRFDAGVYNRLQFLRAVSHSVGAHTVALQPASDSNDDDYYDDEQSTACTATTSLQRRRTLLQQRQMNLLTVPKSASWHRVKGSR